MFRFAELYFTYQNSLFRNKKHFRKRSGSSQGVCIVPLRTFLTPKFVESPLGELFPQILKDLGDRGLKFDAKIGDAGAALL